MNPIPRLLFLTRSVLGFGPFGLSCILFIPMLPVLWLLCLGHRRRFERLIRGIISVTFRVIFAWIRLIGFVDLEVLDQSGTPDGACTAGPLLIANHLSIFDIISTLAIFPDCSTLVKSKFLANPLLAPIIRAAGFIVVNPASPNNHAEAMLRALDVLRAGQRIIIFPEGQRSRNGRLGRFEPGAFHIARLADVRWSPVFFTSDIGFYNATDKWATIPRCVRFRCVILPPAAPAPVAAEHQTPRDLSAADAEHARSLFQQLVQGPLALDWNRSRDGMSLRDVDITVVSRTDTTAVLAFTIAASHPLFNGHFAGFPVFPAVGQIELVETIMRDFLGWGTRITSIRKSKFLAILKPGVGLQLELTRGNGSIDWTLRGNIVYSKGTASHA